MKVKALALNDWSGVRAVKDALSWVPYVGALMLCLIGGDLGAAMVVGLVCYDRSRRA